MRWSTVGLVPVLIALSACSSSSHAAPGSPIAKVCKSISLKHQTVSYTVGREAAGSLSEPLRTEALRLIGWEQALQKYGAGTLPRDAESYLTDGGLKADSDSVVAACKRAGYPPA